MNTELPSVCVDFNLRPIGQTLNALLPAWLVVVVLLMSTGCGQNSQPKRVPVSGVVTLDGDVLDNGLIRLVPKSPSAGSGVMAEIAGGQFVFTDQTGPVIGEHRVEIEASGFQPFAIDDEAAFAEFMRKTGQSPFAKNPVPAVYNSATILTASVSESGTHGLTFHLNSKP